MTSVKAIRQLYLFSRKPDTEALIVTPITDWKMPHCSQLTAIVVKALVSLDLPTIEVGGIVANILAGALVTDEGRKSEIHQEVAVPSAKQSRLK